MTDEDDKQEILSIVGQVKAKPMKEGVLPRALVSIALSLVRLGTAIFRVNDTIDEKLKDKGSP